MPNEMRRRTSRGGFTLIELLTVIGIMCILMAILLPTISTVWKAAKNASSWSEISSLATAINNYKATEGTFPGPVREEMIYGFNSGGTYNGTMSGFTLSLGAAPSTEPTNVPPTATWPPPKPTVISSSENLVIGLLGGFLYNPLTSAVWYNPYQIPIGPYNLNPATPMQYKAYYDLSTPTDIFRDNSGNLNSWSAVYPAPFTLGGSPTFVIPEFMDRFAVPHPIIYLRAKVGAPAIVDVPIAPGAYGSQYYSFEMAPYWWTYTQTTPTLSGPT